MSRILITGGAGFIGANLARRLIRAGHDVTVYDNLSRPGSKDNLPWISAAGTFAFVQADVTDATSLARAARGCDRIYHLAGQVAVTTSLLNPSGDFRDNALGTLCALEAARSAGTDPIFILSSTNKVYGSLDSLSHHRDAEGRWHLTDFPLGIPETAPFSCATPYGCSKGTADLYVRDYARSFGLRTVVFRQSCIYGEGQHGVEDQGWLAWFALATLRREPITIFGDGHQVRDILHVDDLLDAYEAACARIDEVKGSVFNVGGGPNHTLRIWADTAPLLESLLGPLPPVTFSPARPGDQRVFVSDIRLAARKLSWSPRIAPAEGMARLTRWLKDQMAGFSVSISTP